jgi:transposase
MIQFLYGNWDEFMEEMNLECSRETPQPVLPKPDDAEKSFLATPEQQRFTKLVLDEGLSIRVAAQRCGVSVSTGIIWAAKLQLPVKIRPKFIDAAKRTSIEQVLKEGCTLGEVAQSENVCVGTVQKILSGSESLRKEWQEARFRRVRDRWRAFIRLFLQRKPSAGREEIKKSCRAAFAWLSRHDREWLCENLPPPLKVHKSAEPKVDWKQRDREYMAEVSSQAEKIQANYPPGKIPLSHLLGDLPKIRGKLTLMDLMPLTQGLIQQLTGKLKACPRN